MSFTVDVPTFDIPDMTVSPFKMYLRRIKLKDLRPTQAGLKKRTRKDVENLKKSLQDEKTEYPLFVALIGIDYQIIDGHFRHYVMTQMYGEDYEVTAIVFEGLTFEQAKKQCLVLSARYGEMMDVEEWCKCELPSFEIDLVSLGFMKETIEKTKRVDEVEVCPACGKPMKKERKVKTFNY